MNISIIPFNWFHMLSTKFIPIQIILIQFSANCLNPRGQDAWYSPVSLGQSHIILHFSGWSIFSNLLNNTLPNNCQIRLISKFRTLKISFLLLRQYNLRPLFSNFLVIQMGIPSKYLWNSHGLFRVYLYCVSSCLLFSTNYEQFGGRSCWNYSVDPTAMNSCGT